MAKIQNINAREILNTQGNPTIETTVTLNDGVVARSSIPSGSTNGTYEAVELRDNDPNRMNGMGMLKAVDVVNNTIAPALLGMESQEQQKIDKAMIEMDGTQNKSKLGANSILSISQAVAKAAAKSSLLPLALHLRQMVSFQNNEHKMPTPMFDVLEGGKHGMGGLNFEEFLLIPASANTLQTALEIGVTIYTALKQHLKDNNQSTLYAEEGGFAPIFNTNADALMHIKTSIQSTRFELLRDVFLGVDVAAGNLLSNNKYYIKDKNGQLDADDCIEIYQQLFTDFSLVYIEDPLAPDDWDGWKKVYNAMAAKTLIAGDAVTSTNPYRLQQALNNGAINSIVVKPAQIGTVTEALAVVEIAKFKQLRVIVSDRSGETDDDFIADFAVAIDADYVKFGAPARERVIKYDRMLAIESELSKMNNLF